MAAPQPKLRRTPLQRAPRPDLGNEPISKERYTSPEFAHRERERMWSRVWQMAGFERDLSEPGDYFTFEIGPESILVVRQDDGEIRAFHNVCMHRGNRLREPGRGRVAFFECGYHAWRYGRDGALIEPQDEHTFPQGCPRDRLHLGAVRCERWGGFVWLNLDRDAEPLSDYLGVIPEHLDPYHFEEMKLLDDVTVEVDCNWKTSVDAFNEAYHIAGTHPDTLDVNDDVDVPIDCYDRHTRMILKLAVASPRHPDHGQVTERIRESFLATAGVDLASFDGGAEDVRPTIAKAVREVQGPALGADFSELHDPQLVDDFHYTVFPNLTFNIFGRSAWLFRHRPHPTDPQKMLFDFWNLLRAPAAEIPRPAHQHHVLTDDLALEPVGGGGELMAQDFYNLPRIQRGMNSSGFEGLHLGDQEIRIRHFHRTLDGYLEGGNGTG
jgi:phenylpropionate dioxygenase-like ring-hydroxylating dioxygenase large terminal subunit